MRAALKSLPLFGEEPLAIAYPWIQIGKFDRRAATLADRHYSRRKPGSPQYMPPGQTLILATEARDAIFGWWRPDPASGLESMNGLDGWTCTIFRNESTNLSSDLIIAAEKAIVIAFDIGPDGLLTYVWDSRIRSVNPGFCFKMAGWKVVGRSADGRKTLLHKPVDLAGIRSEPAGQTAGLNRAKAEMLIKTGT
jgi:hypothetical protein